MRNLITPALAIIAAALLPAVGRADEVYVYDTNTHSFQTIDPVGQVTAMAYDSLDHQVAISTVESGQTTITRYTYDSVNHTVSSVMGSSVTESDVVTSMVYDAADRQIITSTGNGNITEYDTYDSGVHTYDPDNHGLVTSMTYDGASRPVTQAELDSPGHTTIYRYDDGGNQLSSSIDPNGLVTSMTYDGASRLITAIDDAMGNTTIYQYDTNDNRTTLVPSGNGHVTTMTYDADGNRLITAVDGPSGNSTIYQYDGSSYAPLFDAAGRVTTTAYDSDGGALFLAVVPLPQSFSMGAALLAVMMGARFLARFRHVTGE